MSENIKTALTIMWKGSIAIFVAITIIVLSVMLMNFITKIIRKNKNKKNQKSPNE